jgi:SAM-dependent methyltransferase
MKICISCNRLFDTGGWECPSCGAAPRTSEGFLSFIDFEAEQLGSYDGRFFPELSRLEAGNFWFRYRNDLILRAIGLHTQDRRSLLDVGCGTGLVLSAVHHIFPWIDLSGADLYLQGLQYARTRLPGAAFYQMDTCRMPFQGEFDFILALDVLEHTENDALALDEMFRSLRKRGCIIVTVPQHPWLWSAQDDKSFHRRRYTRRALVNRLAGAGFEITHVTSFITLLLPVMALSRIMATLFSEQAAGHDPMRELRIAPSLNRVLYGICMAERQLLKAGLSPGAGGSLLCIGEKAG